MPYANFVPVTGTVMNISGGNDCCSQMISLRTGNGIVNFMITPETQVVYNRQIRRVMQVAAFYDSSLPVPLIFPPQYRAQLITSLGSLSFNIEMISWTFLYSINSDIFVS